MLLIEYDTSFNWLIGLGLVFGLGLGLTILLVGKDNLNLRSFIAFCTIVCGFVVYGGLLEVWVLIVFIIGLTLMIIYNKASS